MLNIKNFKAEIVSSGILPTNRFLVTITPPKALVEASKDFNASTVRSEMITLRCDAAQIPGLSFATIDGIVRYGYGAAETVPYSTVFEDLTLSFILDREADVHRFFLNWVNCIVNNRSEGQKNLLAGIAIGPTSGMKTFEVGYRDNYTTDIQVVIYGPDNKKVLTATAYRAYPKALPSIDLNWNNESEMMKMTVPFSYTDFDIEYENNLPAGSPVEKGFGQQR